MEASQRVWCIPCENRRPSKMKHAVHMVLMKEKPYDLHPVTEDKDRRLIGVCDVCLLKKNDFQQSSRKPVDVNNEHLVDSAH